MQEIRSSKEPAFPRQRYQLVSIIATSIFMLLIIRVYFLQVVQGVEYRAKSESNFIQERRIAHSRGFIFDALGEVLVDNRASHDVYVTFSFLPDSRRSLAPIADVLAMTKEERQETDALILTAIDKKNTKTMILRDNVPETACAKIEQLLEQKNIEGILVAWKTLHHADGCAVWVQPMVFPSRASVFWRLQNMMGISDEDMKKILKKTMRRARGLGRFKPALLLEDIDKNVYSRIAVAASLGELPGVSIFDSQRRRYLAGTSSAHLLGFTNELTSRELKAKKDQGYRLGDRIGRRGIESAYEDELRGKDGVEHVVVDARGRRKSQLWTRTLLKNNVGQASIPGKSLVLSIDRRLQETAEESFMGRAGAVIAMDVRTGFILAMSSFPTYDPNIMTGRQSGMLWKTLSKDKDRPLTNKAIQDHFAPGSTFKTITAIAGLKEGLVNARSVRMCPGYYRMGKASWRCYQRSGHGPVHLRHALQKSCDTYFYGLGHELGIDRLAETSRLFGFGQVTGLGLDREVPGIIPDSPYYKRRFGAVSPGYVVNASIGQGDVAVTPLQLAVAYAAVLNGGSVLRPQIVRAIHNQWGEIETEFKADEMRSVDLAPELLTLVRESLSHVTEKGGTAYGLRFRRDMPEVSKFVRNSGVTIGGKTGTAQVVRLSKSIAHLDPEEVEYQLRDHAWFVGFAPADNPEVVVVTMTIHGGFGGSVSAPVSAALIQKYFDEVRDTYPKQPLNVSSGNPDMELRP
jgi:penicillin-binding protein 2